MRQLPLQFAVADKPSFANFWVGANAVAHAAARALAAGGRGPLYVFGPSGCGKTHLLVAAARDAGTNGPCRYLSLADTGEAAWQALADVPRDALVCLDDVQAAASCPEREGRLFALFEALSPARRILLAARANPAGLAWSREDVRTRLLSGPVLALQGLEDADKARAVQYRARERGLALSDASAAYLLAHGPRDLRALFVLLERLDHATLADGRSLTIPYLREVLSRPAD